MKMKIRTGGEKFRKEGAISLVAGLLAKQTVPHRNADSCASTLSGCGQQITIHTLEPEPRARLGHRTHVSVADTGHME